MDDTERAWLREKLYEHAAELGAQKAKQHAQEEAVLGVRGEVLGVRAEVRELATSIKADMSAQYNHLRGEILSIKDEDRRRTERLVQDLNDRDADRDERVQRNWRFLMFVGALLVVGSQQLVERFGPALMRMLLGQG